VLQRATSAIVQKFDRALEQGYVARELLVARLVRVRPMRILFSEVTRSRPAIERWFFFTPHELHFGQFTRETVTHFDLLVPLNVEDLRRLDGMRELIAHSPLPIPGPEAIEVCDDKLLFARVMQEKGFAGLVPRLLEDPAPPYVLKRCRDRGGEFTRIVRSADDASDAPGDANGDCFRQELVPGRLEFATHVLFVGGRPVRWLTFEYDMGSEHRVKGPLRPVRKRMIPCRHLDAFSTVLAAIGFEGLCCIDFKERDGRPVILEINPRFGDSLCPYFFSYLRDLV
jgi:predicted ATP-grasp superfamily ATP-dependent carboligase